LATDWCSGTKYKRGKRLAWQTKKVDKTGLSKPLFSDNAKGAFQKALTIAQ